jgi:TPP-dependent pyruvate/acetoin dehydrogenase alpha subunit
MKKVIKDNIVKKILKVRASQILINEIIKKGELKIPIHLGLGHETIAAVIDHIMDDNDSLFLTHRNMHYNIARAQNIKEEFDEYYLKSSGMASGRLGSMNLSNFERGIPYSSSILGNNFAVATGFALGNSMLSNENITMVVTGDGAIEEGSFYESLLFQKSNNLKVITIVENNEWSLGSKIEERRCDIDLNKISSSLSIPYIKLSGNNPFEYLKALASPLENVKKESTPLCIEAELKTLGYWYEIQPEFPDGKFINYHSGKAPKLSVDDNLILEKSINDPLHVLSEIIGKESLKTLYRSTLSQISNELS